VGFFDGVSQDKGAKCGAGALLKCPVLGTFRFKMNCGRGTNTRGELLALWCILWSFQKLKAQHIFRDYNKEANQLSKEAFLLYEDGILLCSGYIT
jgi:hypothetical protein